MYTLSDKEKLEFSHGFDRGNYTSAYETTDYDVAEQTTTDMPIYYRIGHLLGFFSTYELHEISEKWCDEVKQYREAGFI